MVVVPKVHVVVVEKSSAVPSQADANGLPMLVYWNISGLGNSIRLAYQLANVEYMDVRIDAGDIASDNFKEAWMGAKESLRCNPLLSPNLPYLLDGEDVSLTQSDAILRHLGRKYNLYGPPGKEYLVDWVLDELKDLEGAAVGLSYGQGGDAIKAWYDGALQTSFPMWSSKLLADQNFLAGGDAPSIADVKLYMFLFKLKAMEESLKPSSNAFSTELTNFMARIEEYPSLKEYLNGPHFVKTLNNPHAKWNAYT